MIGLSLSFCVREILEGKVNIKDVEKIIAGTNIPNRQVFRDLMFENYAPVYWKKDPKRGILIALDLWDRGLLDQPRTRGKEHPGINEGVWK